VAGSADLYWSPGTPAWATVQRYAVFYMATSLVWDLMRGIGNVVLILAFGPAILKVLRRFHQRFAFTYTPAPLPVEPRPEGSRRPGVNAPALESRP
jgi:energy-coupling factor transport system substrate-specific component